MIFDTCTSALVAFVERKGFGVDKSFSRGHQPHVHPAYDLLLSSNPVILLIIGQSQMLKRAGRGCSSLIGSVALAPAAANPAALTGQSRVVMMMVEMFILEWTFALHHGDDRQTGFGSRQGQGLGGRNNDTMAWCEM